LPFLAYDASSGPKNFILTLTRSKLEELLRPIVERCRNPMLQALQDAKLNASDIDKIILVGGPTRMPIVKEFVTSVMNKEPEGGVDPMEAVALGAAIQGAIISGEVTTDILLVDVTPLTLGVEVMGGLKEALIERNTTIPTKKSKVFTTAADYQTAVTIHVVQGERSMAADCVSLGMFNLSGIPPAPRGVPQIEVTFDIDTNGILNVTAKDLATSKQSKITISASTKLSKEEIEKLKKESEEFAEVDKKKLEEAQLKNESDNLLYSAEKLINQDLKDKVTSEQKDKVNKLIQELKDAISANNVENIKTKMTDLRNALSEISVAAYQSAAAATASPNSPSDSSSNVGDNIPPNESTFDQEPKTNPSQTNFDTSNPTGKP
jgi:molecular chaperone DnaK